MGQKPSKEQWEVFWSDTYNIWPKSYSLKKMLPNIEGMFKHEFEK